MARVKSLSTAVLPMHEEIKATAVPIFDFRSDLVSGIPQAAAQAMFDAARDPSSTGYRDDIHQKALENYVATLCGFEDSLFVPTCTVANQIALRIWTKQKRRVLADRSGHLATTERESTENLNSIVTSLIDGERGHITPAQCMEAMTDNSLGLIWLENTHMRRGGTVMPLGWMSQISEASRIKDVPVHLDGSRLWNAAVFYGVEPIELCQNASSVALSLNKGLGAPTGSLLLGSRLFIAEAVKLRSIFGAGWRPVGTMAAAALSVVENYRPRILTDHNRTSELAARIANAIVSTNLHVNVPDTNIILIHTISALQSETVISKLCEFGVLAFQLEIKIVRLVVHANITDEAVDRAVDAFTNIALSIVQH